MLILLLRGCWCYVVGIFVCSCNTYVTPSLPHSLRVRIPLIYRTGLEGCFFFFSFFLIINKIKIMNDLKTIRATLTQILTPRYNHVYFLSSWNTDDNDNLGPSRFQGWCSLIKEMKEPNPGLTVLDTQVME